MANVTISTTVNSSNYASIFESVDSTSRVINQIGNVSISSAGKLYLEAGWTLACNSLIINSGVPATIPTDTQNPNLYTFAMFEATLKIKTNPGANQLKGGSIYVKDSDLIYLSNSSQYQFGTFDTQSYNFFYIDNIRLWSQGGRLLLQFNRAVGQSEFLGANFIGTGQIDFNAIWGVETNNVVAHSAGIASVGIEYSTNTTPKIGGENGNNWSYFRDWIFPDFGLAYPEFPIRADICLSFIDPDLQGNQVIRQAAGGGPGNANSYIDIRRTFKPTIIDELGNPIDDVSLFIASDEPDFRWYLGSGRTTYTTGDEAGRFSSDFTVATNTIEKTIADGTLLNGGECYVRVADRNFTTDGGVGNLSYYATPATAYFYKYGKNFTPIPLSNENKTEGSFQVTQDALISVADKTVVDSYPFSISLLSDTLTVTGNNTTLQSVTAAQIYDKVAAYMEDNFDGNDIRVDRIGNTINAVLNDINIILDYIIFDGSITLNSTKIVSLTNGSTISGSISDGNGDSSLNITTPAGYDNEITVYTNLADAEAQTNSIASGSSIRYQSATYGGQTLFFRTEQVDGTPAIGSKLLPVAAGVYEVNVATTSENSALGEIKAVTDKLDSMLEVINGNQSFKDIALPVVTASRNKVIEAVEEIKE